MDVSSGSESSEKAVAIQNSNNALAQLVRDLGESAKKTNEVDSNAIGELISTSFSKFLGKIDDTRFEECLDELLATEAGRSSSNWRREVRKKLLGVMEDLEKEISETLQVCKATISSLLKNQWKKSQPFHLFRASMESKRSPSCSSKMQK
jgi:hypothetical protein